MRKVIVILCTMFACCTMSVYAQTKIVTGHPDFKVKVARCVASGKSVVMDLVFQNVGANDVQVSVMGSHNGGSSAYDSEGNIYGRDGAVEVKIANAPSYGYRETGKFFIPTDVPIKCSVRINGVPENVETVARLLLVVNSSEWGIDGRRNMLKISNVPITRN